MPLYVIERNFADKLEMTKNDAELTRVANDEAGVSWLFSFLSADGLKWPRAHLEGNPVDRRIKMMLQISRLPGFLHTPVGALLAAVGQPRLANGIRWSEPLSARGYWRLTEERALALRSATSSILGAVNG